MSYGLFSRSYGIYNANKTACVTDTATGQGATILASASGGVITQIGITTLDNVGNLNIYVDLDKTWHVEVYEETFRDSTAVARYREIEISEVDTVVGEPGVIYVVIDDPTKQYYWDGARLVKFTTQSQVEIIDYLGNQDFSSFTYDSNGKLETYTRQGILHTVIYPNSTTVRIINSTGSSKTINLDATGKVISIL